LLARADKLSVDYIYEGGKKFCRKENSPLAKERGKKI
jgi:hypothetical protein